MASRCSRPVAFIVLFQTMVEIDRDFHSAASYEAAALSLVLLPLSIVNLSMFSIPLLLKMHSTILSAEMFCKVKANFSNHQIFREKFLIYFFEIRPASQPLFYVPFGLCRGVVLKSECKITTLFNSHQTFR